MERPEGLGQVERVRESSADQREVDELARLDERRVHEAGFRRGQPHSREERQGPQVEVEVVVSVAQRVRNHVRYRKPEDASRVRALVDAAAQIANELRRLIDPVLVQGLAALDVRLR